MKFSILIINFNGQTTVANAISSALEQSYQNVEVICVDDASTDASRHIIQEFENNPRFHMIFHEQNRGSSCSRLSGIEAATGDYILFLDSDDELRRNCCATLAPILAKDPYDILCFGTELKFTTLCSEEMKTSIAEFLRPLTQERLGANIERAFYIDKMVPISVWNKCYRADLIKKVSAEIRRDYINLCDDYYFNFVASRFAKTYYGIEDKLICYSYGGGISTARTLSFAKLSQSIDSAYTAHKNCLDFAKKELLSKSITDSVEQHLLDVICGLFDKAKSLPADKKTEAAVYSMDRYGKALFLSALTRAYSPETVAKHLDIAALFPCESNSFRTIGMFYHRLYNGGVERVMSLMSYLLAEQGYNVVVITDEPENERDFPLHTSAKRVILGEEHTANTQQVILSRFDKLTCCIQEHHIDAVIYHAFSGPFAFWDMCAIKSAGAAFLAYCHSTHVAGLIDGWNGIIGMQEPYRYADAIIVLSVADRLFWSRVNKNVHQLCNPLTFTVPEEQTAMLNSHNILWVGRVNDGNKNPTDALHILYRVVRQVPDAKMYICGDMDAYSANILRNLAKSLGISDHLVFTGFVSDVQVYYQNASVMLMTSNFEGFSMAVAESLSTGVPVVSYHLPYHEMTKSSKAVINVAWRDFDEAADAIAELLLNQELRLQMGKFAHEEAQYYSRQELGLAWNSIFESIQNGGQTECSAISYRDFDEFAATSGLTFRQTNQKIQTLRNDLYNCRAALNAQAAQVEALNARIIDIYNSKRYKLGRCILYLPSKVQNFFRIWKTQGLSYALARLYKKLKANFDTLRR